jgi:hypothetical protein
MLLLLVSACTTENAPSETNAKIDSAGEEVPTELSEEALLEIEMKNRFAEDSLAFAELDQYEGAFTLYTESEGVTATLDLQYKEDKQFAYTIDFKADSEEASCKASLSGTLFLDQTQHGFSTCDKTTLHFNFNGIWNGNYVVELVLEDASKCKAMQGPCTINGTYVKKI